jgi:hypothetical protein
LKKKSFLIFIAISFLVISILKIVHWKMFWNNNKVIRQKDYFKFIELYRNEVAKYIPKFKQFPLMLEVVSLILLSIAGVILISQKNKLLKFLAIISFILAYWNLFSLM